MCTLFERVTATKHLAENVIKMLSLINAQNLSPPGLNENRGLVHVFTNIKATNEQTYDLLNARTIGQQDYTNYVTHHILQSPSVRNAPVRQRPLLTMAPLKLTKTRLSQKE